MALSPQDLQDLNAIIQQHPEFMPGASSPSQNPAPQSPGFLSRLGMGVANIPTQAVHDIAQGVVSLGNAGLPQEAQNPNVPTFNPFTIPQAKTTSDAVADIIPGIGAVAASIAIPEMGIARFLQGAGMEASTAKLVAAGAGWGLSGASQGPTEAVAQAGQGMAFQALGGLPMQARAPLAAGLGLASGLYYGSQDGAQTGIAMGGANALMGLIGHGSPATPVLKATTEAAEVAPEAIIKAPIPTQDFINSQLGLSTRPKSAEESFNAMVFAGGADSQFKSARESASIIRDRVDFPGAKSAKDSAQAMIDAGVIPQPISKSANESAQAILEHHYGSSEALPTGTEHLDSSLDPRYYPEKFKLTSNLQIANDNLASNPNHSDAPQWQKYVDYATKRLQTLEDYKNTVGIDSAPLTTTDHLQPLQKYVDPSVKQAEDSAGIIGSDPGRPMPPFSLDNPNPAPITPDKENTLGDLNNALGWIQSINKPVGRTVEGTKLYSGIPDFSALKTLTGQDLIMGGIGATVGGYNDKNDPISGAFLGAGAGILGSKALRYAVELKGGMAHPLEEGATKIPDDHSLQQLQDPVKLASENKTTPLSELPKSPDYKDRTPEAGYMIPALGARFATGALIGGAIGGSSSSDHDTAVRNALVGGMTMGALAIIGPELAKTVVDGLVNQKFQAPKVKGWAAGLDNVSKKLVDSAGRAYTADGSEMDRFVRGMEANGVIGVPRTIKSAMRDGYGQSSWYAGQIGNAWKAIKFWEKPSDGLVNLTLGYLRGGAEADLINGSKQFGSLGERYANAAIASRQGIDGLQNMMVSNLKDGPQKDTIIKSMQARNYLTRTFSIFDPRAKVSPKQLEAKQEVIKELMTKAPQFQGASLEDVTRHVDNYFKDIRESKTLYASGPRDYAIEQRAFMPRKDLSPAWRDFLGEVTDPKAIVSQTVARLRPMAEASHYMGTIASMGKDIDGMQHYFPSISERDGMISKLQNEIATIANPADPKSKLMDKQISLLKRFELLDNDVRYGKLAGGMVSPAVKDTLQDFDTAMRPASSSFGRAITGFTQLTKMDHTAYNPLTKVRDYMTAPLFMLAGRCYNPADQLEAIKMFAQGDKHPLYEQAVRHGIRGADQMHAEMGLGYGMAKAMDLPQLDLTRLNMGTIDLNLAGQALQDVHNKVLTVASGPDNIIRAGVWISARAREAKKLGLDIAGSGHWSPQVLDQVNRAAADFTDRYTVNYRDTNKLVKGLRDKPFVNLYVTYVSEIARIAKNLVTDAVHPDTPIDQRLHAIGTLAAFATVPSLIQGQAESSLSEKDRHDWEQAKSLMPDYGRTRFYAGIQRIGNTNQFKYNDFSALIPHDMFAQMARAVAAGDWKAAAAVNPIAGFDNTPALNIARTLSTGKNLHTQRQMRDTADYVSSIAQDVLPPQFPGIGTEAQKITGAFTKNDQGEMGITNTRTGRKFTPEDILMSYTTGLRPTTVSLDVERKNFVSEAKQQILNEKAYWMDIQRTDLPAEQKDKATERYKLSVANILARVHQKLSDQDVSAAQ